MKWVIQIRGGSDLTLARLDPEASKLVSEVLRQGDQIITDNTKNFEYLSLLGIDGDKMAPIAPVPGSGGVFLEEPKSELRPPSGRRMILCPKAYESNWAKSLPIFEALKIAWDRIQPCEIYLLWTIPETRMWFWTLPQSLRDSCRLYDRISRDDVLRLMKGARVVLTPSLVDGVPNSLYEAMACRAFPIVSPLDTITTVVRDEVNVLFARNLYPEEIAKALIRAMNDDDLVDRATDNNLELVGRLANRSLIGPRLIEYYNRLSETPARP